MGLGDEETPLILLGGGGHCRSTLDVIRSVPSLVVAGILDDTLKPGSSVLGFPVIGPIGDLGNFVSSHRFIVAVGKIGRSPHRRGIAEFCWSSGGQLATVIASTAYVSSMADIGEGTVVHHGAIVSTGARVGKNCIVNTKALIEHDSIVADHVHVSTGAIVNGACSVGSDSFLGSGSVIHHNVVLPDNSIVSAGMTVKTWPPEEDG